MFFCQTLGLSSTPIEVQWSFEYRLDCCLWSKELEIRERWYVVIESLPTEGLKNLVSPLFVTIFLL